MKATRRSISDHKKIDTKQNFIRKKKLKQKVKKKTKEKS